MRRWIGLAPLHRRRGPTSPQHLWQDDGNAAVYPKMEDLKITVIHFQSGQCVFHHCCKTWMLRSTFNVKTDPLFWGAGGNSGTFSCHFTVLSCHHPRFLPEERYNHQSRTDPSVTPWKSVPNGWEIAEAFDEVIEKARSLERLWITFYPEWAMGVVPSCHCKDVLPWAIHQSPTRAGH